LKSISKTKTKGIQMVLEEELEKLKRKLKMGYELRVVWLPDDDLGLSGEVKGGIIYIYEESKEEAIHALKHEFLDYIISQIIEPYREVTNKLIMLINEQNYRKKERLIETFSKFI